MMLHKTFVVFFSLALITFSVFLVGNAAGEIVLYFPFDEGQGETAHDASDCGNDGQIATAEWVDGKVGKALEFNNSYVLVDDSLTMTTQFTIHTWVSPSKISNSTIVQKKPIGKPDGSMEYIFTAAGWGAYGIGLATNINGHEPRRHSTGNK